MRVKAFALVFAIALLIAVALPTLTETAYAHEGGHRGGCEEFGHINRAIGQNPSDFGFPDARNLGDIVSGFAKAGDAQPGVGDIVENIDHAACG